MFLRILLFILLLATPSYAQTDWTADPDCLWALTMDELTGDLIDQCGSFNGDMDGTGANAPPSRTSGKFFGGMAFTAGSGLVDMGDSTIWDGLSNVSFSVWLKNSEDYSSSERDIWRKDGSLNVQDSAGVERVYVVTGGGGTSINIAGDNYPSDYWISEDGLWHMYTITYDGTTLRGYRDCTLVGSGSKTGTLANSTNRFVLGRKPVEESGPTYPFVGDMDDAIVLGRAIDTTECTELMTWGIDGSGGFNEPQEQLFNVQLFNVELGGGS